MFKFFSSIFLASLLITACGEETPRNGQTTETRQLDYTADVAFINSAGEEVTSIRAAVADDDHSRSEGLMDVHNLPSDAGMIFIFNEDAPRSFWMANTPISLDIIYVNSEMEIVRIHRNTPPYSHENIRSEAPAKYVVEVNAGYTMEHDITEGMMIQLTRQ